MVAIIRVSDSPRPELPNRLIEALPRADREHLLAGCEHVELDLADVLCESESRIRYVYFPTDCFVSLTIPSDGDARLEVGLVGDEGMVGLSLALGVNISAQRAIVQGSGGAWRMSAAPFCREVERSLALRRRLSGYLYVVLRQLAQRAVCTHFHGMEARLARRLLMTGDRAHCDEFYITQEFISSMLGVRRAGVNRAAGVLQDRKLIHYSRGHLTIVDRRALEALACTCYADAKDTYARVLG
jgi:CRP-like cAMP-binding protein